MNSLPDETVTQLHTFRLSHCDTCGCARCRRIDQLLDEIGQLRESHSEADDAWMLEGRLARDEHGHLTIARGDTIAAVDDALSNWQGHRVLILIGAREPQP